MQRRKNIKLIVILSSLVVITIATWFLLQRDEYQPIENPQLFSMQDVSKIDSVVLEKDNELNILNFRNGSWIVNGKYDADPQKLTVLFAILNQVRAKRPVADAEENAVDSLFSHLGVNITFFEEGEEVHGFQIAGNEKRGITYFRNNDESYVVNIPGYRSYLAALFFMETSEWRDKLVFNDVSWNNLQKVAITYPDSRGFEIVPHEHYFMIDGLTATDSVKLLDYLDRVSLLTASDYLKSATADTLNIEDLDPLINIAITDIRRRPFNLTVFDKSISNNYLAVKDSADWMIINYRAVDPLLKPREFFAPK